MRFFVFRLAAPLAAILLSGCVATASMGAPATPPPTAPAPTAAPPQIVYVQPPAPAPQAAGIDVLLVALIVFAMGAGSLTAALITYAIGRRDGRQESRITRDASYFAGMYQIDVTPAEYQALTQW